MAKKRHEGNNWTQVTHSEGTKRSSQPGLPEASPFLSDRPDEVRYDGADLQSQVLGKLRQGDDKNKNIKRNFRWLSDRTPTYSPGLTQDHIHALNRL